MALMDVSPQELRNSEIKDAWRGYNRDEVDDLLERAAVTIESLARQAQNLEGRAPVDADALPTNRDDAEMLQRTLLLAQRAADEEVSKAQAQARKLIEESEARVQALVGEAESTARRIAEGERRRLEDEIRDLTQRREQLAADADALEDYVASYRERVRAAIEQDLDRLGHDSISPPTPRPMIADVEPVAETFERAAPELAERGEADVFEVEREHVFEDAPMGLPRSSPEPPRRSESPWPPPAESTSAGAATSASTVGASVDAAPRPVEPSPAPAPQPMASSPSDTWLRDPEPVVAEPLDDLSAPWEHATAEHEPFTADTPLEATAVDADDDLDDDTFFASLREAVRDDSSLGSPDENNSFFDDEPVDERRGHFRRRR